MPFTEIRAIGLPQSVPLDERLSAEHETVWCTAVEALQVCTPFLGLHGINERLFRLERDDRDTGVGGLGERLLDLVQLLVNGPDHVVDQSWEREHLGHMLFKPPMPPFLHGLAFGPTEKTDHRIDGPVPRFRILKTAGGADPDCYMRRCCLLGTPVTNNIERHTNSIIDGYSLGGVDAG